MTWLVMELLAMLVVILLAAELFTNALEHLGERLGISEGVTGSLFAAVGTALPETAVPLLSILAGTTNHSVNEEIGVGSILGAPLMLSTLSISLMAIAVGPARGWRGTVHPERSGFLRDLEFFLIAFVIAAVAMYVPPDTRVLRLALSAGLVATYVGYIVLTLRASARLVEGGHATEAENRMHLSRLGLRTTLATILAQLLAGLVLIVFGAEGFISAVDGVSRILGISPLLLSLLVIPIATELPEKLNSILWIRRGRDTLAVGNITGAMVFQGTLLPAIGILLTPWQPRVEVLGGVLITLGAATWLRVMAARQGIPVWAFGVNGALYAVYLAVTLGR
jgi:cation:H+ antiporter